MTQLLSHAFALACELFGLEMAEKSTIETCGQPFCHATSRPDFRRHFTSPLRKKPQIRLLVRMRLNIGNVTAQGKAIPLRHPMPNEMMSKRQASNSNGHGTSRRSKPSYVRTVLYSPTPYDVPVILTMCTAIAHRASRSQYLLSWSSITAQILAQGIHPIETTSKNPAP